MAIEIFDIGRVKPPFAESDVPKIKQAIGPHTLIIREALSDKSRGGLYLPGNSKIVRRRGWVLFAGTGTITKSGLQVKPPWQKGDYLTADRKYDRPDPTEDDLCVDPAVMVVEHADVLAMDPARRPPADVQKLLDAHGD